MDTNGNPIKIGSWYKMNVISKEDVKYFGVNVVGMILKKNGNVFEYSDGNETRVVDLPCTFEPISSTLFRKLSLTYSNQGYEGTCFAHAATLMIFHNMYNLQLREEDKQAYLENNCNLHLDTTRDIEDYQVLRKQCGDSGSTRIVLFLYIYKVITNKFGCNGGMFETSILYYLNTSFQPIFNSEINLVLMPIYKSVNKESFDLSYLSMKKLPYDYKDYLSYYFEDYYGGIYITNPPHAVAVVAINKFGIVGKNSSTSSAFVIPFHEFKVDGTFHIDSLVFKGIEYLYFLYKRTKIDRYPVPFKNKLTENKIFLEEHPSLKVELEKEYREERARAMERQTKKIAQEARLEKLVSESIGKKKKWFGGKKTRKWYGTKYSSNHKKV